MSTTIRQSGTTIIISHTRGDTLKATINLENYVPIETDKIMFGMKSDYNDTECIVSKRIPSDTLLLHLLPEDTASLTVGDYVFDISIELNNGDVYTLVLGKIKLTNDVYSNVANSSSEVI